jgi:AraC family cel operon transcriptional repressor
MDYLHHSDFFDPQLPFYTADTVIKNASKGTPHTHDFYEFFIVKEGELIHSINENTFIMSEGTLFLIRPKDVHSFQKAGGESIAIIRNVAFSSDLYDMAVGILPGKTRDKICKQFNPTAVPYYILEGLLWKTSLLMDITSEISFEKKMSVFHSLLFDVIMLSMPEITEKKQDIPEWLVDSYSQMREKANYMAGLARFIEISGKTQEHLTRCMKSFYGITPTVYINSLRLQEAARLLTVSEKTILEIIYETGFNNTSHFNKLFKEKYGVTPSVYRKRNRSIVNPK